MAKFLDINGLAYFKRKLESLFAKKSDIPTNISAFTNDSDYQTSANVDSKISTHNSSTTSHNDIRTAINGKVDDYTKTISTGGGGSYPIKFLTVDYNNCTSETGVLINVDMVSGHGNGSSYKFLQQAILSVNYLGNISADIFKYYGAELTYDNATRQYGDVFWTHDSANKIVVFYCLVGQYGSVRMTPYKRLNSSNGGVVTQHTGSSVAYSSGTKVWGNNQNIITPHSTVQMTVTYDDDTTETFTIWRN